MRQPTFLARREWKTVPWSAPGSRKDIMASLLEQVVDLPSILWRHDQYKFGLQTHSKTRSELRAQLRKLCASIRRFEQNLHGFKRRWVDSLPLEQQPVEVHWQDGDPFPIFRYTAPVTRQVTIPSTLVYSNPQLAQILCIYYAAMLILASVDVRPVGKISESGKLEFAHLICRSIEYYIRAVPGNMINRLAFPLRVAYDSLPGQSLERGFIEAVFQFVERKKALRSWGRFMPGISTKSTGE